jgi:hypothetical protein
VDDHTAAGRTLEMTDVLSVDAVRVLDELIGDRDDVTIGVLSAERRMLWASAPGSEGMFGRELQDFAGAPGVDFIHPEDAASFERALERIPQGETVRWTGRASTGGGDWVRVTSIYWSVQGADDEPLVLSLSTPASAPPLPLPDEG